jgi:hypothetical protein
MKTLLFLTILFLSFPSLAQTGEHYFNNINAIEKWNYKGVLNDEKNMEYVNMDLKIIQDKFNVIADLGGTVEDFLKAFPEIEQERGGHLNSKITLAGGIIFREHEYFGGYATFKLTLLSYNNKILKVTSSISTYYDLLKEHYVNAFKVPLQCPAEKLAFVRIYDKNVTTYQKTNPRFQLTAGKGKQKEAFTFFADYEFNHWYPSAPVHVDDNYISKAMEHAKVLMEKEPYTLLEDLLYSVNRTGQIFAAATLNHCRTKKNYTPTPEIVTKIEYIKDSGTVLTVGTISCWMGRFNHDYVDIWKDYDKILAGEVWWNSPKTMDQIKAIKGIEGDVEKND